MEPFSGAVQLSGETNTKQGSPGRSTLPFTLQTAMETGPQCPGCGPEPAASAGPQGEGRVGRRERGQAVTQPLQLPREHFTTSPIPCCLLDGASKAIPGLYFIVTFICKGCQSGPEVGCPAALRSSLHTHTHTHTHKNTHTHTCPEHTQRTSKNTQSGTCHGHTDSGSMNRDHPVAQPQVRRSHHCCSHIRSLIPTAQSTQVSGLGVHRPVST